MMRRRLALAAGAAIAALLLLSLAGCAKPPAVPADAVQASSGALPGLALSAWVEQRGGYVYLNALLENDGSRTYETKEDCGYLWQSELRHNGSLVAYAAPEERVCDWVYDFVRPGGWRQFLHSWDGRSWDDGQARQAPPGEYVWTIRFVLRDGSDHETKATVPGRFLDATVVFTK